MKKFLVIMGGIFLVLIIAVGFIFAGSIYRLNKYDAESKVYIENIIPPLLSNFTTDTFLLLVSDEDKPEFDRHGTEKLTEYVNANFGSYKSHEDLKGGGSTINLGGPAIEKYVAKVNYEKGSAYVQFIVMRENHRWWLGRVDFSAPTLDSPTLPSGVKP